MPRITRAALRSQVLLDDVDLAISTPLPSTPKTRVPLGEIAGNKEEIKNPNIELPKVGKKQPTKGKERVAKKGKKQDNRKIENQAVEVLEDDNQSATSSAVEEACDNLMQESSGAEVHQVVMRDERPHTPASPAVSAVKMQLNSLAQVPKFDPKIHRSQDRVSPVAKDHKNDSFLEDIDSRTPAKMTCSGHTDSVSSAEGPLGASIKDEDESFIEQIMKRSPVRQGSRIEDSVEAIDAFEEAIEKVGELIPAITEEPRLPSRIKKQRNAAKVLDIAKVAAKSSAAAKKQAPTAGPITAKTKRPTERVKMPTRKQPSPPALIDGSKVMLDHLSEVNHTNLAKSSTTSSSSGAPKSRTVRVSSIHKAPFQPTKSTKPTTRSTFELPGETIARKLKEQKEERLKRSEEESAKKATIKARPVLSQVPVVKATATSRARMSLAKADPCDLKNGSTCAPTSKPVVTKGPISTVDLNKRLSMAKRPEDVNKRLSTLSVTKRSARTPANTSARIVRAVSSTSTDSTRKSSLMGPPPRPVPTAPAPAELAQQKLKGREVFNRIRVEQDERDRIKKEKEEAAKKARAEAAERGRIASREWAERQKLKNLDGAKRCG